ncbi:MAG: hypothetical protein M3Z96_13165 [Pseudomonadota bacterium]|nr:hypothetical protein [Pseudomonadota bacterium]
MTQHSHQTAPTQFVDAAGARFAYRRFGKSGGVPLVFNIHFTGTMNHWDPAVTDDLAATREVILFNNAGISSTSGDQPRSRRWRPTRRQSTFRFLCIRHINAIELDPHERPVFSHRPARPYTAQSHRVYKFLFDLTDGGNWLVDVHASS